MGIFEDILASSRRPDYTPPDSAFPELPVDEAALAEEARQKAGEQLIRNTRRRRTGYDAPDAQSAGVQYELDNAPPGTGVPFSTQAGMLAPPVTMGESPGPIPLPAPRPPDADAPRDNPTDISSQGRPPPAAPMQIAPQVPQAAPQQAPDPFGLPSILSNLRTTLGNNSNTLLALGAGLAGAPNIGQGISRAAAAAIPARAADLKQTLDAQSRIYGVKALVDAGVPVQQAIAAQGDKELKQALVKSYIEDRGKDIQMIKTKDPWGGETEVPYVKNKFARDGEPVLTPAFKDAQGGAAPVPGGNPSGTAIYAPGINQNNFDHSKVADEYLGQFSPEMQSDVKSYLAGRSLPAGKTQQAQAIKQIAKKYGDDIGMPGDDTAISQRKAWATSLGDTKSGVGLQSKGLQQGLEHFVKLSDNLVNMNLSNGLGLEPVAGAINSVKNLTTEQQRLVHKGDVIGQALSREMGNLFAKNGGGVHEAAETKKHISNSTMSSKSAAGSLEAIDELMQGGLRTLEQRRDELFPNGNAPKGSNFMTPKQEKELQHIRDNIAILKGEKPAAAAAPEFKRGGSYKMLPDGTVVPK